MSASGSFHSGFIPPSAVAPRPPRQREYTGYDRIQESHHPECGYSGPALWHIGENSEFWTCPPEQGGCGEVVCVYDGPDLGDESRDMPHVDDDGLEPPSSYPREVA